MNFPDEGVIISSLDEISSGEELIYHRRMTGQITPKVYLGICPAFVRKNISILRMGTS